MLEHFGVSEENWRDAIAKDKWFAISETPTLHRARGGRAGRRPGRRPWSGRALSSGVLAKHYGFTNLDGSQSEAGRFFTDAYVGDDKDAKAEVYR
jgi:hypothetical protein